MKTPDLPCADCGKLMVRTKNSLPDGQARCHPCRRIAHGVAPDQRIKDVLAAARKKSQQERRGNCHACGSPVPTGRRWKYCSDTCFRKARSRRGFTASAQRKATTSARGYGIAHQLLRAQLLPLAYGTPCHLCGELMKQAQALHLDHTEDRTGYRGMVHAVCNLRDGARRGGRRGGDVMRKRRLAEGRRPLASHYRSRPTTDLRR